MVNGQYAADNFNYDNLIAIIFISYILFYSPFTQPSLKLRLASIHHMDNQLEKINNAASGLLFMSETDAPFEAVEFSEASLDQVKQKIRSSSSSGDNLEEQEADYFFRNHVKEYPEHGEEEKAQIQKFKTLILLLKENLADIKVYRVGSIQIDAYIIGKLKSGKFAGLKTKLVET
jgi:hypothetical protein